MKTLITGSTGYVGAALCEKLAAQNIPVRALVRSRKKAESLPQGTEVVVGDIMDRDSLRLALEGCNRIYHTAALVRAWTPDPNEFYQVNVEGTKQLFSLALEAGVNRIVMTSTAGVMGPAMSFDVPVNERSTLNPSLFSVYDHSKLKAEKEALRFAKDGIEVMVVNPSRIYGPGIKGDSNSVSRLIEMFRDGKWRFIPGDGNSLGNYVFIEDVVAGHLLAMQEGMSGQRYILGGTNASYNDLFKILKRLTQQNHRLYKIPVKWLMILAKLELFLANTTGKKPMIVPEFVRKLTRDWHLSSDKAVKELGYQITDLETGIKKTLDWLENE